MTKVTRLIVIAIILLLPCIFCVHRAVTQDCFVQIVSVSLNKPTLSIGETIQVNVTYSLYYDTGDPLGIGAVSVSISTGSEEPPLRVEELTQLGTNVKQTLFLDIQPQDWEPNEYGQIGVIQVDGWVQDSYGSMTDYIEHEFWVIRSEVNITLSDIPPNLVFHEKINLNAQFTNPHNASLLLVEHPVCITASRIGQPIQTWFLNTSEDGQIAQEIDTTSLGTGSFICNITSQHSEDYLKMSKQIPFNVTNADIFLDAQLNATTYQAYYPSMNNCTATVTVNVTCLSASCEVQDANVTWVLDEQDGVLSYKGTNKFASEISMPNVPGNYNVTICATLFNHNIRNVCLPLVVEPRRTTLLFTSNRTHVAYGDFIDLAVTVLDYGCHKGVSGKEISIYVQNNTEWVLLTRTFLNNDGYTSLPWQNQQLIDEDQFVFKVVFHGGPEFEEREKTITIDNTRNIRFFLNSELTVIRDQLANCTLQITTLDNNPIPDLEIQLVEVITNETWCFAYTNTSGIAFLSWNIPSQYELGEHQFYLTAQDPLNRLGSITITMIVYDATVIWIL